MILRDIADLLREYATEFRSIAIVGPRQSGKTTLAKSVFTEKPYVTLEDIDIRTQAETDTRGFLSNYPNGAIIDEVQRVPQIFNYLQTIIDNSDQDGLFILTGSNHFSLQENISQTLAGRIGFLDLYPLTLHEIEKTDDHNLTAEELIFRGFYPEVIAKHRNPRLWYSNYIRTYIERDIKLLKNIENSIQFIRFIKLCAGRVGQILNYQSLCNEAGVDFKTCLSWLGILQSSFIIRLIQPYHNNFNKRVIKSPKLYFNDTGLVCHLLGIRASKELEFYHGWGALFENFVLMEISKNIANKGFEYPLYYWRDSNGIEVDIIIDRGSSFIPIEIKAAQTYQKDFSKSIRKIQDLSTKKNTGFVIYQGEFEFKESDSVQVIHYKKISNYFYLRS